MSDRKRGSGSTVVSEGLVRVKKRSSDSGMSRTPSASLRRWIWSRYSTTEVPMKELVEGKWREWVLMMFVESIEDAVEDVDEEGRMAYDDMYDGGGGRPLQRSMVNARLIREQNENIPQTETPILDRDPAKCE